MGIFILIYIITLYIYIYINKYKYIDLADLASCKHTLESLVTTPNAFPRRSQLDPAETHRTFRVLPCKWVKYGEVLDL